MKVKTRTTGILEFVRQFALLVAETQRWKVGIGPSWEEESGAYADCMIAFHAGDKIFMMQQQSADAIATAYERLIDADTSGFAKDVSAEIRVMLAHAAAMDERRPNFDQAHKEFGQFMAMERAQPMAKVH